MTVHNRGTHYSQPYGNEWLLYCKMINCIDINNYVYD